MPPCVSLALPRFLQGPVASLAERGCPCPSLPVPRLCPAYKPVETEALSPQSCLCPGASCRDRAVLLLSDNIPIWALIDLLIPSPGPCYAESLSPAQPSPAISSCPPLPHPSQAPEQSSPRSHPVKPVTTSWSSAPVSPALPWGGFLGQHRLLLRHPAWEMLSCPSRRSKRRSRPKSMTR